MKVDEVSGPPEVPQIRSGEIQRLTQMEQQNAQPPKPPDQVVISQAARFAPEVNSAARTEKLRQAMQKGLQVNPKQLANTLANDGVVP